MKFEITWSTAQWIALAVQLMAVSVNIYAFYLNRKFMRVLKVREANVDAGFESLLKARPEAIAAAIQSEILLRMTHGVELFERVQNDVIYLHDALYRVTAHPADCAICRATAQELEGFIKAMRGAKVDIMPPPQ